MDFAAVEPALIAWVKTLTGLDVVVFENAARPYTPGAYAVLSWMPSRHVGVDETRFEDTAAVAPDANLDETVVGCSVDGLQVTVQNRDQRPGAPHASAILATMRARLRRGTSLAALKAVNLGLVGADDVTRADYAVDGRMVAQAVMVVRFNATSFDRDADGAVGSLERAEVTSHLTDPAGTSLADTLQMDHEVIG